MQVTVSEKVGKLMLSSRASSSASTATATPLSRPAAGTSESKDYSQGILLRRINLYLASVHKDQISEAGYCHGIVLLWLTMMSWGVESLFFEMIKVIAECPVDQLDKIGNTIELFLDMIEVGQNPYKFSNNACTQQNVDEIIGEVIKLFGATATYSKTALEAELKKLAQENNMMAVTGWWEEKTTKVVGGISKTTTQEKGHTVGVFVRRHRYHFFDPNFKKLGDLEYFTEPMLVTEIWSKVFEAFGKRMELGGKLSLNAVHRKEAPKPEPPKARPSTPQSFTGDTYRARLFKKQIKPLVPDPQLRLSPELLMPPRPLSPTHYGSPFA